MKDKIVIVGGGEHANVVVSLLKKLDTYEILGYTDVQDNGSIFGIEYLGNDDVLSSIKRENKNCKAFIGIGMKKISYVRNIIYEMLKNLEFELPIITAKSAIISDGITIGEGTILLENSIIYTNAKLGKCCMIHSNAIIEHDCELGDFVSFATGAIMAACSKIGNNSILSVGSIVVSNKTISSNCFIGAGSVAISDILTEGTYYGVPARKIPS